MTSLHLDRPGGVALPAKSIIKDNAARALAEDLGPGDLTASLIPFDTMVTANIVARESAVLCGSAWLEAVMHQVDTEIAIDWLVAEGQAIDAGSEICRLGGRARSILSAERCALNFLQTLSATATAGRRYVDAVAHTSAIILDTRKTVPGLRAAQKYAARLGGAVNHRTGLFDGVLIKENHILAAGSIAQAVSTAKQIISQSLIVVEVETLDELRQACEAGAHRALLDNFDLDAMREAVALAGSRISLEASGGVELSEVAAIAETGVDYISIGAITKHIRAVDLSLRIIEGA